MNKNCLINDIPKHLSLHGIVSSCKQDAANPFATHFSFVYASKKLMVYIYTFDLFNNVFFSVDDVYQSLTSLRSIWSVGPNCLCGDYLFQLRQIILYPF